MLRIARGVFESELTGVRRMSRSRQRYINSVKEILWYMSVCDWNCVWQVYLEGFVREGAFPRDEPIP